MKTTILIAMLALAAAASNLSAQDGPPPGDRPPRREGGPGGPGGPGPGGPGGEGRRMPVPPLFATLDANHDGVIDEQEIADASSSLKKLDKNGDGKLTMDELRPPRPDGERGPGPDGDRRAFRGPPRDGPNGGRPDGENRRPQRPPPDQ
ncbi:MAG TPA: EF-hand domain-containing protein [Methylomirabilota bacterium]|nr:EF-hand domain-containing protein [Methylomirabilota bacterium]